MNDTEKRLAADIKVFDTKGNLLRKEVRDNFPKKRHTIWRKKRTEDEG